jgi:anti-anti-sigma factor
MLTQRPNPEGGSTVKLVGELDAATLAVVEPKLYALAESEDTTIDLASTTFGDLGSVRMLVRCRERARLNGRFLRIVNAPPHVERMLEMLERGHYWRPERVVRRGEGDPRPLPKRTTTDSERSRPESEQIVRLECRGCGFQTFRPEKSPLRTCENCGSSLEAVAVFRDRRRIERPVDNDRRHE